MSKPVAVVGAVLVGSALLIAGIAWKGTRHPAPLAEHTPPAGGVSGFPVYWMVARDAAVLADAEVQLDEARAGLEQRAATPFACLVSAQCIHEVQPRAEFDEERAAARAALASKSGPKKAAEDAWGRVAATHNGYTVRIDSADRSDGFGIYLVIVLLLLAAGILALADRYGRAMIALVVAFFPTGFFALTRAPLAILILLLLPLAGVALLYAQGVGGGALPPFFATFEAALAVLPASERGARIRREMALGTAIAVAGLALFGGLFLLAGATAAPVVVIAPGLFVYGVARALRGLIAARPARP